jgi:hypothetical protein
MNTQAENLAGAATLRFPAKVDPVPLARRQPAESGLEKETPEGSARPESKPRARSIRAKRNLPEESKITNAKHGSERKGMAVILRSSARKKNRTRSDQTIARTAVCDEAIPPVALRGEELPAASEVLPEPAAASRTEDVVEQLRWSEGEIQADCYVPAENRTPRGAQSEPDWPATQTITLAKPDTPRLGEPPAQAEKRGLLTVTLRVRRSPLAIVLRTLDSLLTQAWNCMQQKLKSPGGKKRLRVCESVSLGEKRFVAVIQVDGEQFLVGGSASSVSTLAHLERPREFSDVFQRHCKQDLSPA